MSLQRKALYLLAALLLTLPLVPLARAHADVQVEYFSIGRGSLPYLIGGAVIPYSYSDDRGIGTKQEYFRMTYSTDNGLNWRDVLNLRTDIPNQSFQLPIEPSLISVMIRLQVKYSPILGSDTYIDRTLGPFKVMQPGEVSDLKSVANDDGSITLAWNDNSNMESAYLIKRDGPDGSKYFQVQNASEFGPVSTIDKTTSKTKNTLYAYTISMLIDQYDLPDNIQPGVETTFIFNKAPLNGVIEKIDPGVNNLPKSVTDKIKPGSKLPYITDLKPIDGLKIPDLIRPGTKAGSEKTGSSNEENSVEAMLEDTVKDASGWAKSDLKLAIAQSLTTPSVLGSYQKPITREHFAGIAVRLYEALSGQTAEAVSATPFTDTFSPDVLKASQLGIVTGVTPTTFSPGTTITRQELCVMLLRAVKAGKASAQLQLDQKLEFADSDQIAPWALEAVHFAVNHQIMNGVGNNQIDPLGPTTREQAIVLVKRTYDAFK